MKVILYMAITTNGLIAKPDGNSDFTSEADTQSFNAICQKVGTIISGRKTYEVLYPDSIPLETGTYWVLTHDSSRKSDNPVIKFTNQAPAQLLTDLEKNGVAEVVLIGGSQTVSEFVQDRLVNEIYLDIEPVLFGKGLPLVSLPDFETKLDLLSVKNLSPQTVQLHYKVLKS